MGSKQTNYQSHRIKQWEAKGEGSIYEKFLTKLKLREEWSSYNSGEGDYSHRLKFFRSA
jgi:hypothetical protein